MGRYPTTVVLFFAAVIGAVKPFNLCTIKAIARYGKIETGPCDVSRKSQLSAATTRSHISLSNLRGGWTTRVGNEDELLLNVTYDTRGSGEVTLHLTSQRHAHPLFCGTIKRVQGKPAHKQEDSINVRLQCKQEDMEMADKLELLIDQITPHNKRDLPNRLNVDLPGCALPEFKNSALCKVREEKKIRFQVRRIVGRPAVRVILPRNVYKSRDLKRGKRPRYYIEIREESPPDVWIPFGRLLQSHQLRWPKRNIRFRKLALKKTYVVVVSKVGKSKRFTKKITVC